MHSEGEFSYPEPAIPLLMAEVWPAALWAALKLPLRWRLLLTGERERKADAPSFMPAAAWLVKELSLPKCTEVSVEGPKMFAMRLLGYKKKKARDKSENQFYLWRFNWRPQWYLSMDVLLPMYLRLREWEWIGVWRSPCSFSMNSFFQLADEVRGLLRRLPLRVGDGKVHQR